MDATRASNSAKRIILLDDDEDSRESFAAFMRLRGLQVEEYEAAEDVLASIVPGNVPAVIILDITLGGGMDGYEAALQLRALPAAGRMSLVALTGHSPDAVREKSSHFDAILTKPVDPDALVALIAKLTEESLEMR